MSYTVRDDLLWSVLANKTWSWEMFAIVTIATSRLVLKNLIKKILPLLDKFSTIVSKLEIIIFVKFFLQGWLFFGSRILPTHTSWHTVHPSISEYHCTCWCVLSYLYLNILKGTKKIQTGFFYIWKNMTFSNICLTVTPRSIMMLMAAELGRKKCCKINFSNGFNAKDKYPEFTRSIVLFADYCR